MSVDQTGIIDLMGIDNSSGNLELTISDHLEWESKDHLLLLQEKINTYLNFIESEEVYRAYPNAQDRNIVIHLVCRNPPDRNGIAFLSQVASIIKNTSMKFKYTVGTF